MGKTLLKELLDRERFLKEVIEKEKSTLKDPPTGRLRCSTVNTYPRYYIRSTSDDRFGKYIPKKNIEIAKALAQKEYDEAILKKAVKELDLLKKVLEVYPKECLENVYNNIPPIRQALIEPVCLPDDQYVERWLSVPYERKGFSEDAPEYYTVRGERVRSKSEIIIADILNRMNIPYRYEFPIRLKGAGIIHPDFTVLKIKTREEMLWEHLGMMDDAEYAEKALERIDLYLRNGYYPGLNQILTHETSKRPIRNKLVEEMIDKYFR